jgi:hypothetical protein
MSQRSLLPLLIVGAAVPVAVSLHAKTSPRPAFDAAPHEESHVSIAPAPRPTLTSRAPTPGTLAASLDDHPPPAEASPRPTKTEWLEADGLNVDGADRCTAYRVREWLQLRCRVIQAQQVSLLGGQRDGLTMGITVGSDWIGDTREEIVMPLRRGDRRVIGLTTAQSGRYSWGGPDTEMLLSEVWLDGASPVVRAQ